VFGTHDFRCAERQIHSEQIRL